MRLTGRRESSNVEDRRGRSGGGVGKSLGIGGIIVVGLITLLMGGDLGDVFNNVSQMGFQETTESTYTPTAEDEELAKFTRQILAGTEDVWTQEFKKMGKTYELHDWLCLPMPCSRAVVVPHHLPVRSIALPTKQCTSTFHSLRI